VLPGKQSVYARWAVGAVMALGPIAGCGGDDEREPAGKPAAFGYGATDGPSRWASLDPAYEECAVGRRQSPIDLKEGKRTALPKIDFAYRPAEVKLENNGHSVEAEAAPGSKIEIAGAEYALKQFHFHAPSEHRLDGRALPLEFHFVHEADGGGLVVLGVLVEEGRSNPAFSRLVDALPREEGERLSTEGKVSTLNLLPEAAGTTSRWSYGGSLTTPPCTEGVRWEVFDDPIEMSRAQIDRYTAVYSDTNRPIQPLNGRRLTVSD
jgi:carbonic anhydrase